MNLAELARFWRHQLALLPVGSGGSGTASLRADLHTDLARLAHALESPPQQALAHLRAAASEHGQVFADPTADTSLRTGACAELALALAIVASSPAARTDIARAIRQAGAGTAQQGRVAEALAALLLDEPQPPSGPVESTKVRMQLAACEALARNDGVGFLTELDAALQAEGPDDAPSTDRLLALTELALCRLAIERGVVGVDALPEHPAFPHWLVFPGSAPR